MDREVEDAFDAAIAEALKIGHHPTRFIQMRNMYGTMETVRRLLISGQLQEGIVRCAVDDRLDLSVEQLVLDYKEHFDPQLVAAAKWRLEEARKWA